VWGAQDRLIVPRTRSGGSSPDSEGAIEMIDGAGQHAAVRQPDAFVATVQKFLG